MDIRGRARFVGTAARAATAGADRRDADGGGRDGDVRLHRHRSAAAGQRQRGGGGDGWVYYETIGGGQGGRPTGPGQSGIHTGMTNTSDTPIEAFERAYPMRVLRYRLRRRSAGAGVSPGGEGIEKVIQVLEPATV